MNEFTAWIQSNWYELGTLLSEVVFLAAGIWFARKILRTLRASQEQVGALLKLSARSALGHSLVVWLNTPMSSGGVAPWRRAIRWLQSPAGT